MADIDEALDDAQCDITMAAALLDVVYMEIEANADFTRECADHVPELRRKSVFALTHEEVIILDNAVTQVTAAAKRLAKIMEERRTAALKRSLGVA